MTEQRAEEAEGGQDTPADASSLLAVRGHHADRMPGDEKFRKKCRPPGVSALLRGGDSGQQGAGQRVRMRIKVTITTKTKAPEA